MTTNVEVKFYVLINSPKKHAWTDQAPILGEIGVPGDVVLSHVNDMFEDYASSKGLSCCGLQGGFILKIDDKLWNSEYCVDEFWMTSTWFTALVKLLENDDLQACSSAFPWEQSNLVIRRSGDSVNIKDGEPDYCAGLPADVNLWKLVNGILQEGRVFHSFIQTLVELSEKHKSEEKYEKGAAVLLDNLLSVLATLDTMIPKLQQLYDTKKPL